MGTNRLAGGLTNPPPPAPPPAPPPTPPPAPPTAPATLSYDFINANVVLVEHNQGRRVLAQVYNSSGQQITAAIQTITPNILRIIFSTQLTGTVVIS